MKGHNGGGCSGCGEVGHHDKRTCPKPLDREQPVLCEEDETSASNPDDESSSLGNGVECGGYTVRGYGSTPFAGYASGPPSYHSAGYTSNTGYQSAAPWSTPGVGGWAAGSGGTQSASSVVGYGNQGWCGHSGYSGIDGYGNQGWCGHRCWCLPCGSYGAIIGRGGSTSKSKSVGVGGEQQGAGVGYMGSGYYDANFG